MAKKDFSGTLEDLDSFLFSGARRPEPSQAPETKSKALHLLVWPSVYEALKVEAAAKGQSLNDLINRILKEHAFNE